MAHVGGASPNTTEKDNDNIETAKKNVTADNNKEVATNTLAEDEALDWTS